MPEDREILLDPSERKKSCYSENHLSLSLYYSEICLGLVLCKTLVQTQTLSFYTSWLSMAQSATSGEGSLSSQFPLRMNQNTS